MRCLHCCSELTFNANFCSNCGNRVFHCSKCRNQIDKTDKFCRHCGFENSKDTCRRCHSFLAKTDKFCKNCGLENKDVCQEEQYVDANCSYGGNIWNPPNRDVPKQLVEDNYAVAECIEGSDSKEFVNEQSNNDKSIRTTSTSQAAVETDLNLEEGSVDVESAEDTDPQKLARDLSKHKHQHISLAIAGDAFVGKSTFINLILDNKEGDENYAETGDGDTTMEPKRYCHPRNATFTITDMPGYGTRKMPMEKFVDLANISQYDYFLLFFNPVLREVDMRMAEILGRQDIPFALVRTKLDVYLKKQNPNNAAEATKVIEALRKATYDELQDDKLFGKCKVFLISKEPAYLATCDMTSLIRDIADKLTEDKYEAFLLQIGIVNRKTIDMKYEELKRRIPRVAQTCALIAASWVPLIDVLQNYSSIVEELNTYVQSFGLDKDFVPSVPGVKSTFSRSKIRTINWKVFLGQGFSQITQVAMAAGISQVDFVIPIAGSAVSGIGTHYIVSTFLKGHLDELRDDALTVYQHFNKST